MLLKGLHITIVVLLLAGYSCLAQVVGPNDTIRLGSVMLDGKNYPYVFLDEVACNTTFLSQEDRNRINKLRNNVYVVYPYAITAAAYLKQINEQLDKMPDRHSRKQYLKSVNKDLDRAFKEPLKNLSIEQGHVLIKLINRQTGRSCYDVIRELKGGLSAVMWQSVGVVFNNNLAREYDPEGRDKELERIVKELELSTNYRYQLYLQDQLMKKVTKR